MSTVIKDYVAEHQRESSWTPKTTYENESAFKLFLQIVGDIPIATIDSAKAREVRATLQALPPNLSKDPKYRDKSLSEVIALAPDTVLSNQTYNKHISRLSGLFNWAERQGHVGKNPFKGLSLTITTRAHEQRHPFDDDDLRLLFGTEIFKSKECKHPHYYWLPLLGLYTGARINEVCQLHLADIRQEQGVWVLDINDQGTKQLKTLASTRLVPLHSRLVELGFLEYVERLRARAETRLFPELKHQRDGYSQAAQKWFNARYRSACGITQKGKSFHSFRHTFINQLKQRSVDGKKIGAMVGHADDSMTTGRYGKPYEPAVLKEVIELLSYPLDLKKHDW